MTIRDIALLCDITNVTIYDNTALIYRSKVVYHTAMNIKYTVH